MARPAAHRPTWPSSVGCSLPPPSSHRTNPLRADTDGRGFPVARASRGQTGSHGLRTRLVSSACRRRDVGRDIDLHHPESLGVVDPAPEWRRRHSSLSGSMPVSGLTWPRVGPVAFASSAEPVSITCLPVTGSCPPNSRIWHRPPRYRMPVRSFGACFLRAMRGRLSSGIGQSVGQRSSEDHRKSPFALFIGGGQGRGRTADLPIFRTRDNSSPNTVNVRDLHRCIDLNTDERK